MEMTELERRELEQSLRRDLEQLVRDEARSPSPLVPRKFEVGFGSERSAPELQRGLDLGDGVTLSGKIDRIDLDPGSARGIVQDYKSGRTGHSAAEIEKELRLQIPLYMLVLRDLVGIEPLGGLYRPLAGERRARGLLRADAKDDVLPGFVKNDYLEEDAFWAQVEGARDLARGLAQRIRGGRRASRPEGDGRLSGLVRPLANVPDQASMRTPNDQQAAAIAARGQVFVSAGAGTGKTTVLVERFVEAVCERGLDVESMLVITYTERAAGELRGRIRSRLHELGRHDLARSLDGAWISTIHGFCLRLLKAHPFAAGLDPRFRVLDDSQGRVIRGEAFEAALNEFCAGDDPARLRLLATYGAAGLRRMLTTVYETLRSAGRELALELGERPGLDARLAELAEASRCLADDAGATDAARAAAAQALVLTEAPQLPERLLDLSGLRARGERAATYEEARKAVEQAALDELALRDRELLQELLLGFAEAYAAAKDRESALDFEDLQLRARDLLRENETLREREQLRFRSIMVDEFQDTNRLQCELVDLLTGPDTERFFVGDEFQSIYGFRHADVQVFRERRAQADTLLPLTRNYRSRPEVLSVVNHLFGAEFGEEFQPLAASGEFPDPVFGTPVELLVTDKTAYADSGVHWRRAEARHVARRVKELVDSGAASAGEIVLLFAAGTDAEWYEEELREAGLATYRATGRGYFGQQQVVDLLSYLRLLQNRYDDEALVSVLASPFVGVSNDALLLIRRAARGPIFTGLERSLPADLDERDVAAPARVPAALRPARGGRGAALARAALRADRRRPRLRPRRPCSVGRPPPLREPAQARTDRPLLRGAARPGPRELRSLRRGAGGRRRGRARRGRRGGGSGRGAPAHDPRREGARVQGGRRRRRRTRPERAVGGRDSLSLGRALRLPRRRPGDGQAPRRAGLRERQGRPRRPRTRPNGCACTTSR